MTQAIQQIFTNHDSNLMEKVVERSNIKSALERVEKNKGAAGVDGMETRELRKFLQANWQSIEHQLLHGTYEPQPVRRVEIPKPDGGVRELGIPTVLDRFIQQAIQQILTPVIEPIFSENSYGFRPKRSARQAIYKAKEHAEDGYNIVVDIDLAKFFDTVNHDILMSKVMKLVHDKRLHKLIRHYLKAGVMLNGVCVSSEEGTPQGGPLSPLLSNIMLHDLDAELSKRGHRFIRYADDCNIYVRTQRAGERVYQSIKKFIETKLKLKINELKSAVDKTSKRKFLGFTILAFNKVKIGIAMNTIRRFKTRVRKLTKRAAISMEQRIEKLNEYLMGWSNYFRIVDTYSIFRDLDQWIRRRLRMCYLKQWKQGKTKLNMLKRLGLKEDWAGCIAFSRKKYWRLANTLQMNKALNNAYWNKLGLVNMTERYHELHVSL